MGKKKGKKGKKVESDSESEHDSTASESGDEGGSKLKPLVVVYCAVCGLPPEFCSFGSAFEKCKPWLKENALHLYPELGEGDGAVEEASSSVKKMDLNKLDKLEGVATGKNKSIEEIQSAKKDESLKTLPGGKIKKKADPTVVIARQQRNKRKFVTSISGLGHFGVKLGDASKIFSKKFSCGASATDGTIDIQGDVLGEVLEYIEKKSGWEIPRDVIWVSEDGKNKVKLTSR